MPTCPLGSSLTGPWVVWLCQTFHLGFQVPQFPQRMNKELLPSLLLWQTGGGTFSGVAGLG